MTIKEIASRLGFSPTTVSVCLSGRENDPRFCIRREKAEQIRAFARAHGYVPDSAARRLRAGRDELPPVGLLFSESFGSVGGFASMRGVMDFLTRHGRTYQVLSYMPSHMSKSLEFLRGMRVRDVIVFGPLVEPCEIHHPSIVVRKDPESSRNVDAFLADWEQTALLLQGMTLYATDYQFPRPVSGGVQRGLIRMGIDLDDFLRRTIRKINDVGMGPVAVTYWSGNEDQMVPELIQSHEHILPINYRKNRYAAGRQLGKELIQLQKRNPIRTAFFGNDRLAAGIIAELVENGVRVPEDIAVIGFGNDDAGSCFRVPLSTFDSEIPQNALEAAKAIIEKKKLPEETHTEYHFVQRNSFKF